MLLEKGSAVCEGGWNYVKKRNTSPASFNLYLVEKKTRKHHAPKKKVARKSSRHGGLPKGGKRKSLEKGASLLLRGPWKKGASEASSSGRPSLGGTSNKKRKLARKIEVRDRGEQQCSQKDPKGYKARLSSAIMGKPGRTECRRTTRERILGGDHPCEKKLSLRCPRSPVEKKTVIPALWNEEKKLEKEWTKEKAPGVRREREAPGSGSP